MASRLEIVNLALAELGEEAIASYPEPGEQIVDENAGYVVAVYPPARNRILAANNWSWAQTRAQLTATGRERQASWPFEHEWNQPDAVGAVRALYDRNDAMAEPMQTDWIAQGPYIYTDFNPVWADYQRLDLDEEVFPPLVVDALQSELCARLALPIKEDIDSERVYRQQAREALKEAVRVDAQAVPVLHLTGFGYIEAHFGGRI